MRRVRLGAALLAAAVAGAALAAPGAPPPPQRWVSASFDDVLAGPGRWDELARRLDGVGATAVGISAGRLDWTSAAWPEHPERQAPSVLPGQDPFGAAVARLGAGRDVTAVVDVMVGRYLDEHPGAAALDERGAPSSEQVSTTELTEGAAGRRLLELVRHLVDTYPLTSVDLTELHHDDYGFGPDDLRSFRRDTGAEDWPRTRGGGVDRSDPALGRWRSERVAALVEDVAAITRPAGVELLVDVRVAWDDPSRGSAEDGQDYAVLLRYADRLVVWDYFALAGEPPQVTGELVDHLGRWGRDRFVVSVGLWAPDGTIPPRDLRVALAELRRTRPVDVWVTPAHLLTDAHWSVLLDAWAPTDPQGDGTGPGRVRRIAAGPRRRPPRRPASR